MKLYIPTTSLNFNNILSSESLSPEAFYSHRKFGYRTWHSIEENKLTNSILLYNSPRKFQRPKGEYDDYPLLIEIDVTEEEIEHFVCHGDIYQCDHTIYLTPETTQLYFFAENEKKIALSKSEGSLESKVLKLYQEKIKIREDITEYYTPATIKDTVLNQQAIEKDRQINKMKGLLIGYYIGVLLSSNLKYIQKLNNLKQTRNILSAIIHSINGEATSLQKEELKKLLIQKLEILFDENNLSRLPYYWNIDNFQEKDLKEINFEIETLKHQLPSQRLNANTQEIVVVNGKLSAFNPKDIKEKGRELYPILINEVFASNEFNGNITPQRSELADQVTRKTKEIYKAEWEGSTVRTFFNDLRRHIGGAEFTQTWSYGILCSIAAVILKGDDWQTLLEFMETKEIYDYRYAFGIYGTLNGYASLPRNFTDILYDSEKEYVISVCKEINCQLLNRQYAETVSSPHVETIKLEEFRNKIAPIKGIAAQQKAKIEDIFVSNNYTIDKRFFDLILQLPKIGKVKIESIKKAFDIKPISKGSHSHTTINTNNNELSLSFEDSDTHREPFYKDRTIFESIYSLLPNDKKTRQQFKIDLEWFQNNFEETYYDSQKKIQEKGCYYKKDTQNSSVINMFESYLSNKQRPQNPTAKMKWLYDIYQKINIDLIISKLKKIYL